MNKEALINRNNLEVNKLAAKCLRITTLFLISLWLFLLTDYTGFDKYNATVVFIGCLLLLMIPTILVNILKINEQWLKFYVIICTVGVVLLLSIFISSMFIPLLVLPMLVSTLYCDKKLIFITTFSNCLVILLVVAIHFYNGNDGMSGVSYKSITDAVIYGVFLKIVFILLIALFAFYIVDRNMFMLNKTIDANRDLMENQKELVFAFSELSENKSKVTGEHIRRVSAYMKVLAEASGFEADYVEKLSIAAMMHDIGKLMIPEEILDKPDKLTEEEYAIMKNHVLYGDALLAKCPGDIMQIARTIALQHHERWDGSGYLGMKGDEIAYISRLMAICDVFDALTSQRYYKEGWSLEDTYDEIVRLSGIHFDPDVVELFKAHYDEFKDVLKNTPDQQIY